MSKLGRVMWVRRESKSSEGQTFLLELGDELGLPSHGYPVHVFTREELEGLVEHIVKTSVISGAFAAELQTDLEKITTMTKETLMKELEK